MKITLTRSLDELDALFAFTRQFAEKHGLSDTIEYALNLALEEVFTNCVKYNSAGPGDIAITLNIESGRLFMEIVDPGERFDITGLPGAKTDVPLEQRKVGGLGVHLTREMMDGLEYYYKDDKNHVIIVKNLENYDV